MNIKHSIKKHPKKWCAALVMLVALWYGRSFLPMMFLWGDGVTITLHVPENIEISDVSARYYSTNCKEYWYGTGNWANLNKDIDFKEKKYQAINTKRKCILKTIRYANGNSSVFLGEFAIKTTKLTTQK